MATTGKDLAFGHWLDAFILGLGMVGSGYFGLMVLLLAFYKLFTETIYDFLLGMGLFLLLTGFFVMCHIGFRENLKEYRDLVGKGQ